MLLLSSNKVSLAEQITPSFSRYHSSDIFLGTFASMVFSIGIGLEKSSMIFALMAIAINFASGIFVQYILSEKTNESPETFTKIVNAEGRLMEWLIDKKLSCVRTLLWMSAICSLDLHDNLELFISLAIMIASLITESSIIQKEQYVTDIFKYERNRAKLLEEKS